GHGLARRMQCEFRGAVEQGQELAGGGDVAQDADYRRLLDRKDVDAVIVATWDNLHSQIAADACKAGKDVYVEKPMTSLPKQGQPLVRAVRDNKRVLQVGTQQRSMANFIEAKQKFIDSGLIGEVNMVRTVWNGNSGYLTPVPPGMERQPDGLDWNACLGWLPKIPWDPKRYFNRFAYWDFSTGGQTGGLFVHMIDVVHWYLKLRKPLSAVAGGGIYQYNDGRDTPDNVNFILEYPQKLNVTFEATITDMSEDYADIVFMGTGGRLSIFRKGYTFTPGQGKKGTGIQKGGGAPETGHMANWLECVRSRKDPAVPVEEGHYSAMACHLGNMAYREKRLVKWQNEWDL
ncbi:MAG: Gfo/Idh/MocA family oxidoreductase, partial [Acidobacteriia bacterium]|nr:Gfo/Idh/MocA family oxidoreductase [Terriglobia bacterium]